MYPGLTAQMISEMTLAQIAAYLADGRQAEATVACAPTEAIRYSKGLKAERDAWIEAHLRGRN